VEVARAEVRSDGEMARLYRAIGTEVGPSMFETQAARNVQWQVKEELFARTVAVNDEACPWSSWRRTAAAALAARR
jgi:hypothetical protein